MERVQHLVGRRSHADIRAGVVLLSGCQDDQLSFDGVAKGQFTASLLQVWAGGRFSGDHRAFHRAILDRMPPDRSPDLLTVGANPQLLAEQPFTISGGAAPAPQPVLRAGARGPAVAHRQGRRAHVGYRLAPDGSFGAGGEGPVDLGGDRMRAGRPPCGRSHRCGVAL